MTKDLFLSYSRTDGERLAPLLKGLKRLDHRVWVDQELSGGQEWWDEVLKNIRACDAVLFALSAASLESSACESELDYAMALRKPILPVVIEGILPDLLPPRLARLQMVDFTSKNDQAVFDLVNALQSLPAAPPLSEPLPDQPPVPVSYLSGLGLQVQAPSLSVDEQYALIRQLRAGLERPRERDSVVELMHRLARREELMVGPSKELDRLLAEAARLAPAAGVTDGSADHSGDRPQAHPPQGPAYRPPSGVVPVAAQPQGPAYRPPSSGVPFAAQPQPPLRKRWVWPVLVGGGLVGAIAVAAVIASLGNSGGEGDGQAAADRTKEWLVAFVNGEEAACDMMLDFASEGPMKENDTDYPLCTSTFPTMASEMFDAEMAGIIESMEINGADVAGDTAVVDRDNFSASFAEGFGDQFITLKLVDGEWYLDMNESFN